MTHIADSDLSNVSHTNLFSVWVFADSSVDALAMTLQSLAADNVSEKAITIKTKNRGACTWARNNGDWNVGEKSLSRAADVSGSKIFVALINAGDLWLPGKSAALAKAFNENPQACLITHSHYPGHIRGWKPKLWAERSAICSRDPISASVCAVSNKLISNLQISTRFPKLIEPQNFERIIKLREPLAILRSRGPTAIAERWGPFKGFKRNTTTASLLDFRQKFCGQRCFIVGNGPSLKQTNLDKLEGEWTLTSNRFYLHYPHIKWRPQFHACIDAAVLPDIAGELQSLAEKSPETTFFFPESLGDDALARVRWETSTLIKPFPNICFFQERSPKHPNQACSPHSQRYLHRVPTVTGTLLQLAILMGFSPIYLIGCDTAYSPLPGAMRIPSGHPGGTTRWKTTAGEDFNHFTPEYFGPGRIWREPRPENMLQFYTSFRAQMDLEGKHIFNATPGGRLEAFPRVAFDSLFT
ncbi:MAG: DUF115 domain-containing protein [Opitutales bacterium]|nr:DUF115 domain-containing protein [Opitutales bacterium]MCH8539401.1 DUF115 domain-containing protein [Opitutales bacterium]